MTLFRAAKTTTKTDKQRNHAMSQLKWLFSTVILLSLVRSAVANEDHGIWNHLLNVGPFGDTRVEARQWPMAVDGTIFEKTSTQSLEESVRQSLEQRLNTLEFVGLSPRSQGILRKSLNAFYVARDFRPIWIEGGQWSTQATKLLRTLERADEDGLDPNNYTVNRPDPIELDPNKLARADISLSVAAVQYARDARGARVDLARLSKWITPKLELPDARVVLVDLANSADPGSVLVAYNPQHRGYLALKEKLAEFREYTASIAPAPTSERSESGASKKSMSSLPPSISEIIANMERWRWLPSDLGSDRIEVNLPEFTARVIRNDQIVHQTRVIIGKQTTPTPLFSNQMVHLIVNPSWHVPSSIIKKEILPKLAEDPEYAIRNGYEITELDSGGVSVRQPPGQGNALGLVKFMFPNEHAVYLHDTPTRKLFANDERAFSHGCVRVENPFELASVLLDDTEYSETKLKAMIGKGERLIRLKTPMPIHLTYFTILVEENGAIRRISDIYGYDRPLEQALKMSPSKTLASLRRAGE